MRVAVTGTPGSGKTTATELLAARLDEFEIVHLGRVIERADLYEGVDDERESLIVDVDAVESWLGDRERVVIDSHLSHLLGVDRVVVLRCAPSVIESRLRERGESPSSAQENAESEAIDGILSAAVEGHGTDSVYEVETTDAAPEAVAAEIEAVIRGDREPSAGTVSYTDYL